MSASVGRMLADAYLPLYMQLPITTVEKRGQLPLYMQLPITTVEKRGQLPLYMQYLHTTVTPRLYMIQFYRCICILRFQR